MAAIDQVPKSRITIKYKTEINGQMKEKEIPFKLLVAGDFSKGSSKDRKFELDEREIRELDGKNLNETMKDMGMKLSISVPNKINPEKDGMLDIDMPITGMNAFNPAYIAENVPQLKSLLYLRELVENFETTIDNNKNFRKVLGKLLSDREILESERASFSDLGNYKLPEAAVENAAEKETVEDDASAETKKTEDNTTAEAKSSE